MGRQHLILCLLASKVLLCASVLRLQQRPKPSYSYCANFVHPPTYCRAYVCHKSGSHFTLFSISFKKKALQLSEIPDAYLEDYKRPLEKWWPVLTAVDFEESKHFWKNIYKKHGATENKNFNPREYIELCIFVSSTYGKTLNKYLEKHGIYANGEQYKPKDIGEAIRMETKKYPAIRCVKQEDGDYLLSLGLCFNDEGTIIHCFRGKPDYCPLAENVYFVQP